MEIEPVVLEPFEVIDTGCELHPACLNCPLPKCIYDTNMSIKAYLRTLRAIAIIELVKEGEPISEIAEHYNLSIRQVQRIVKSTPVLPF